MACPDGYSAGVLCAPCYQDHLSMSRWLFLPNSAIASLRLLSRLSSEAIDELRDILEGDFGREGYSLYLRIGELAGVPDQDGATFHSFWEYVQDERRSESKSGLDVISEFVAFIKSYSDSNPNSSEQDLDNISKKIHAKRQRLAGIFGDVPGREHARKVNALEAGPLPHISSFKSFCDLRPVFDKNGTNIVEFVPSIVLRIRTHGYPEEHKEILVQSTESQISTLENELRRLRKKLEKMRGRFPGLLPEKAKGERPKGA